MSAMSVEETSTPAAGDAAFASPDKGRTSLRWFFSAAIALLAHGLIGALIVRWQAEAGSVEPTAAVVIELAPLLAAPDVQPADAPPVPQQMQEESPQDEALKKDVAEEAELSEKTFEIRTEAPPLQHPETTPEVDVASIALPSSPIRMTETEEKSDVELATLPAESDEKPAVVSPPQPKDARPQEQTAKPRPAKPQKPAPNRTASRPQASQARAELAQAPAMSAPSNSDAMPNWRSQIIGILERNKRYPPDAQARQEHGVSNLAFSLNRQGQLMSARISGSSGSPALDAETLALVRRVQPFPPPPPEVGGSQISLVVAIRYNGR